MFTGSVKPVDSKAIDWDSSWKSYRDLFGGRGTEVCDIPVLNPSTNINTKQCNTAVVFKEKSDHT